MSGAYVDWRYDVPGGFDWDDDDDADDDLDDDPDEDEE